MKTIDEIRLDNLLLAISRAGTATALAEKSGLSAAYISQIKNRQPDSKTGKPKNMGDDAARKIESGLGEMRGWMDVDHSTTAQPFPVKTKDRADQTETTLNGAFEAPTYNPQQTPMRTLPSVGVRPIVTYESLDELPKESTVLITRIDVKLSAGNGRETWHIEEREPLPFQADYIRSLDSKPKNLVAAKVKGDSMEPRLFDKDTVVVDTADQRVPANGGVFALVYAGELLVKRLFRLPDGGLKVVSDNQARYEPVTVGPDQIEHVTIIGRVKYRSGMGDF
ncbi:helix-turn-helix transcriptional regulator [Ralstonia nicotianae]|uniref:helix-turn-helix transcriptional regulator n=1 Tax=Ralstonia pseudosolanacearum TaxID=1310165 RepID=UPI00336A09E4